MAAGTVGLPEGRVVAAKRKGTSVPADRLRLYERLLAAVEGVESKSNFGSAYTAVNGNMYSMISKHGVVGIRLPADERAAFVEKYDAEPFRGDPSWPPAKEYVAVPDDLLEDTDALRPYLERSYQYARTLKAKPSRSKR
jgi:TfoX/Sxy family transcriptional regulator of competence genes